MLTFVGIRAFFADGKLADAIAENIVVGESTLLSLFAANLAEGITDRACGSGLTVAA